ncbi:hypothetical protein Ahy_B01g051767 isoform B [Arachis hypogaea]|uniref:Uncharacterized protein n=1 Tax=Arachis hypogaea TaxID=3818 RepID=A0A445AMS6_ARAHY|nr:hypothetical protein Ahy_B01g051767 isoform B [Arachis hypogaea]
MEPSICEEGLYDTFYDVSDYSNCIEVNVPYSSDDDTQRVDKVEEAVDIIKVEMMIRIAGSHWHSPRGNSLPSTGILFELCKESWEPRVKAASWVKKITTTRCRVRMYVMLNRQKNN